MTADKKALAGFVGFANLPNQVHRQSIKKGFEFTLMVVGESGLGKSTFVNTLYGAQILPSRKDAEPTDSTPSAINIESHSAEFEEKGVRLRLNVIDTPGFGDFINNDACWKPIAEYIQERFDSYLDQERRVNRRNIIDNRIHACLYFIPPTGHGLREIDIEFMKNLHNIVNLVPVIAKADTLTPEECQAFKARILQDIADNEIKVYDIPIYDSDDVESKNEARELMSKMPFAVVSSETEFDHGGKKIRGRRYPWGVIDIENEEHCDFVKLRQMLIRSHLEDLRAHTNEVLYEEYRSQKLSSAGQTTTSAGNPLARLEEERRLQEAKLKKMDADMKQVFGNKVKEKEAKLKQTEEKMRKEHEQLKESQARQRAELEERRAKLEEQMRAPEKKAKKRSGIF